MAPRTKGSIRNICIFGVGGVGGYFGGKIAFTLARKKDETRKVFFIARGSHLQEIRKNGLILNTSEQDGMVCRPHMATDTIDDVDIIDLCLVCVKSYDLHDAIIALSQKMHNETVIIPLLNGVDIYERIRGILTEGVVLPSCVYIGTHIEKPGTVTQRGKKGTILYGNDPLFPDFDTQSITEFFREMEVEIQWFANPFEPIWEKYIFIASYGLVTAYSNKTLGEVVSDNELRGLVRKIMTEVVSIGERKGIHLSSDIVNRSIEKARNFPFETKTSYQRDLEVKGKLNEGDLFGGTIIRLGRETGTPTPVTEMVYRVLGDVDNPKVI